METIKIAHVFKLSFIFSFILAKCQVEDFKAFSSDLIGLAGNTITLKKLPEFEYKTFIDWYNACKSKLKLYRKIGTEYELTTLKAQEFQKAIDIYAHTNQNSKFADKSLWVPMPVLRRPSEVELDVYVQKLIVPNGSEIAFHGDLHGDIFSLLEYIKFFEDKKYIDNFKIIKPNFYLVFLGDCTDRGNYGAEVLYTLMRLKIANPDNVILIRGNHEDININFLYGFVKELQKKFHIKITQENSLKQIEKIYDYMPVALYLGSPSNNKVNYIQCCHGGIEIGFEPIKLLEFNSDIAFSKLGILKQHQNAKKYGAYIAPDMLKRFKDFEPTDLTQIGFLWNDFILDETENLIYSHGRGFAFGKELTASILKDNNVKGIFRAHQHSGSLTPMMQALLDKNNKENLGIAKLWNNIISNNIWENIVVTYLVAPDTPYGSALEFDFDAFGILNTASNFSDWDLKVYRNTIIK